MKRIKNKIEGVRPFNLFTLRSCYYYQTVAGLASFGIPYENILMGYLSFPQKNFQIEKKSFSDKEMGKIWGYKSKACNLSLRGFLRNIDKHNPVIAGIDCFYVESRPEAYRKKHSPHWILVHGYDLDIGIFDVVEQDYSNSYKYTEKTISISNLLYGNIMYRRPPIGRKKACRVLIKKRIKGNGIKKILERIGRGSFEQAQKASEANLETLKTLILQQNASIQEKSPEITAYLKEMKYSFSIIKKIEIFTDTPEKAARISFIVAAYSNLLSVFWKMENKKDYGFAFRYKDNIIKKIDDLLIAEYVTYNDISEGCKCWLKQ